ncbi:formylmethanofuran dehydrogenase subunit C [Mariniblastus sp.]|nr:formylmethanofuran dehydrogenase subunit C [Mariniblastus sp.]MDB4466817.1 formylmethanofuran dehydrogenase subunit C [bacterium]MDB4480857.1 formylmethanofuran dehydrogenase subunit C [bacterium]
MALTLNQQVESKIPIEAHGILPELLFGKTMDQIKSLPVPCGNEWVALGELFSVSGAIDQAKTVIFNGSLSNVNGIGMGMDSGVVQICGDAGNRIGVKMSGGRIRSTANVGEHLGSEMTGGVIVVEGDAGDSVGSVLPGSKVGVNRGTILVRGSVGKGAGESMRRGMLVVGGDAGDLLGWSMRAGTLVVMGKSGAHVGAEMKRGTIVLGGGLSQSLASSFREGGSFRMPAISLIANWLKQSHPGFDVDLSRLDTEFNLFHGDFLHGGRGEILIPAR